MVRAIRKIKGKYTDGMLHSRTEPLKPLLAGNIRVCCLRRRLKRENAF